MRSLCLSAHGQTHAFLTTHRSKVRTVAFRAFVWFGKGSTREIAIKSTTMSQDHHQAFIKKVQELENAVLKDKKQANNIVKLMKLLEVCTPTLFSIFQMFNCTLAGKERSVCLFSYQIFAKNFHTFHWEWGHSKNVSIIFLLLMILFYFPKIWFIWSGEYFCKSKRRKKKAWRGWGRGRRAQQKENKSRKWKTKRQCREEPRRSVLHMAPFFIWQISLN